MNDFPRYLVDFDARILPLEETDVVVIGGGVAGLSTAIEAHRRGLRVLVIAKSRLASSNTARAQGGIAAELSGQLADLQSHEADTVAAGDGLCDPAVVARVVAGGAEAIAFLKDCGCGFDGDADGTPHARLEAAHSHERILHFGGDATGAEIQRALTATARECAGLRIAEKSFVIDLLLVDGVCAGVLALIGDELRVIAAAATVLASGGCGALYRESSNSPLATGDGMALALRAGALLRDLEMVQFHPTLFYVAGAPRVLVTEAIRGAGGKLRNAAGEEFTLEYDPRGALAPRDVVCRAIVSEMRKSREAAVFLDVTHLDPALVREKFPGFVALCERFEIDTRRSWVPVRPGPHYMIGGVRVDTEGRTSLAGLYAAGEATSSGLHGANRLASNSLLEGVVMGRAVGQGLELGNGHARALAKLRHRVPRAIAAELDVEDLSNTFRALMWRCLGVERHQRGMEALVHRIGIWRRLVERTALVDRRELELCNMLQLGQAMTESALFRRESRGAHYRSDYPEHDPALATRHVVYHQHPQWET